MSFKNLQNIKALSVLRHTLPTIFLSNFGAFMFEIKKYLLFWLEENLLQKPQRQAKTEANEPFLFQIDTRRHS